MNRMLQTHFGAPLGAPLLLVQIRERGFQWCRVDTHIAANPARFCSTDLMLEMVDEVNAAGMGAYVITGVLEHLEALPAPPRAYAAWRNEPDIPLNQYVTPAVLAAEIREASVVAGRNPIRMLGAPVVTNPNKRGVAYTEEWLEALGGLPDNVFGDIHRYHRNDYPTPHKLVGGWAPGWWPGPFQSREDELRWFKRVIGEGRLWGVSEWGYQSTRGELAQAKDTSLELDLHEREGAWFSGYFQLNDDPGINTPKFGIRDVDGNWKLVSRVFLPDDADPDEVTMPEVDAVIRMADSRPHPTKPPGTYFTFYPTGQDETILSVQPNGDIETRMLNAPGPPPGVDFDPIVHGLDGIPGAYESWTKVENLAVFYELPVIPRASRIVP